MSSDLQHALSTSYARSGFSNRMGWGKRPALLIIDVCKAYWTEGSPLSLLGNPAAELAPDSMRQLLSAAREGDVPVIWSEVKYSRADMSDAGLFWLKAKPLDVWLKGDNRGLADYMDGLEPALDDTVIVKKYASAFFGTTLATELQVCSNINRYHYRVCLRFTISQTLNVDTLVICGVSTSGCVRATTLDAMQHGFRPMVRRSSIDEILFPNKYET